jgi:hypothetical protein
MFRAELLNGDDADYQAASRGAFQIFEDVVKECVPGLDAAALNARCLLAWSTAHGFASLCLEGAILPEGRGARLRMENALERGRGLLLMLGPGLVGDEFGCRS